MIQTAPDSADTLEAYIPDEDVVGTMFDDMLDLMGLKNCKICDDSDSICGGVSEIDDDTYSLSDSPGKYTRDKNLWISEPNNGAKYLVRGNNIVYLSDHG